MDADNWRLNPPSGESTVDIDDWRTQLQPDSRQRIVNKITDTLKRHLSFSGQEGLNELRKIALRFEEKIFTAASSRSDYLRRISLKMLTMEPKNQNTIIRTGNGSKPPDPAGNSENLIYNTEQEGSECPAPDTPYNGMPTPPLLAVKNVTHGNALKTDCGKSNVADQQHDPRVTMFQAKPMSLESLSTSVVTMVDEAAAAVGEDLAAVRKRGLHARSFFPRTGLTEAVKMRCFMSAMVTFALVVWCIFFLNRQH